MYKSKQADNDAYILFKSAIEVVNRALEEHEKSERLGAIGPLIEKLASGRERGVSVYSTCADSSSLCFTVWLSRGRLELAERGQQTEYIAWEVSQRWLQQVCDQPQAFMENPERLDVELGKKEAGPTAEKPLFSESLQAYSQTQDHCPRIKCGNSLA